MPEVNVEHHIHTEKHRLLLTHNDDDHCWSCKHLTTINKLECFEGAGNTRSGGFNCVDHF